jgi:phosphopantothenoylcysteine decarboxylase/phosphopantothenate--cysteine ligase
VFLVAPATANTVAKLAHGLADNLLTSAALAATCPVVVAPAMNNAMYEHPATQANLRTLRERGVTVLDPGVGALASKGEWGVGRLAEPEEIAAAVEQVLGRRAGGPWDGLRVLVTAGGTREAIDSVRYVGNRSSGRVGIALAQEAAALGADVTVVAANVTLERDPRLRYVDVESAAEMQAACVAEFGACDVLLMAAAVADFRPAQAADTKLKKDEREQLTLVLERTDDILSALSTRRRPGQTIVGFAAEHGDGALAYGRDKLARKGLDAIVVNDIARADIGFDSPENEVTIITVSGEEHVARSSKAEVARAVLATVTRLRAREPAAT